MRGVFARPARWTAPLLACMLATARGAGAQQLSGVVRERASRLPVPGATVMLQDSAGATLARGVTNERGQYRLARANLVRRVRVVRMGFRPATLIAPDSYEATLDVDMTVMPSLLDAVATLQQPRCPRRADRPAAFALWEGARDALLALVVARETDAPRVLRLQYYRIVGEEGIGKISQTVHGEWVQATRPYGSRRTAADFVREGFRDGNRMDNDWFAPDADVLLDDDFALNYCLQLATPAAERPRQVGLHFEPSDRARAGVRISGTLWVDTAARTLTDFEFRYLGLTREERDFTPPPGGHVGFRTMPNGIPFIDRWSIRAPAPRRARTGGRYVVAQGVATLASADTGGPRIELHEFGGELASARWSDGSEWRADLATIRGRVLSQGVPLRDREVWLVGTDYRAISDTAGRFEISEVVPGRYAFSIPDSQLNELGLERTRAQHVVAPRGRTVDVDVEVPTIPHFIAAKCGARLRGDTVTTLLAARIVNSAGDGVPARVTVKMSDKEGRDKNSDAEWPQIHQARAGAPAMFNDIYEGEIGVDGMLYLCKITPNRTFVVEAEHQGETGEMRFDTVQPTEGVFTVLVRLARP